MYHHVPLASVNYLFIETLSFANVQLVKHDIVTAVIYCYIATDFHYAKRDSRLSVYGGVMLQRVCALLNNFTADKYMYIQTYINSKTVLRVLCPF